jgi:hypothetical protein
MEKIVRAMEMAIAMAICDCDGDGVGDGMEIIYQKYLGK